jgi:Dolichyl-phosphate-mannose-protein mannosyltransferase
MWVTWRAATPPLERNPVPAANLAQPRAQMLGCDTGLPTDGGKMTWTERSESFLNKHIRIIAVLILACGLALRLYSAFKRYLGPDESLHYTVAAHPWHGLGGLYVNSTHILHPPLLIALLQPVLLLGHSEVLLRIVPVVCGALFPWFAMLWVQRIAGSGAALCAQFLLTFSPALIELSAEIRAYTLAFLLLSVSLLFLEKSLDSGNRLSMLWSLVFLYLAILSEYSVAWFVAAAGMYVILRLWGRPGSGRLFSVWGPGQLVALGLFLFLYKTDVAKVPRAGFEGMYSTWLQFGFPRPHESLLRFALSGTLAQFRFLLQGTALAWAGGVAFLFGIYRLWRAKSPPHAILMVLPFCVACLAAIFHFFPYGASRHTAILDIAIAATVGTAVARLARDRVLPLAATFLLCALTWVSLSAHSRALPGFYSIIAPPGHEPQQMHDAAELLRKSAPADALILTDSSTDLTLGYYLGCPSFEYLNQSEPYPIYVHHCGSLNFAVYPAYLFAGTEDVRQALAQAKGVYGSGRKIWVAAIGLEPGPGEAIRGLDVSRPIAVFQESDIPPQSPPPS